MICYRSKCRAINEKKMVYENGDGWHTPVKPLRMIRTLLKSVFHIKKKMHSYLGWNMSHIFRNLRKLSHIGCQSLKKNLLGNGLQVWILWSTPQLLPFFFICQVVENTQNYFVMPYSIVGSQLTWKWKSHIMESQTIISLKTVMCSGLTSHLSLCTMKVIIVSVFHHVIGTIWFMLIKYKAL